MLRSACISTSSAALACRAALPRAHAAAHLARPACHSVWLGNSVDRRTMATTSGVDAPAAAQPDYYRVLGLKRTASSDEVKAAFRDLAKKHHPDVLAASSTAVVDMEFFKLLNEAYKVLSDPLLRREYDSEKFSRATLLRMRNEGRAAAGADGGIVQFSRSAGGGLTAEELAKLSPDEAFQRSVERANERVRDNMRFRATLARANRAKVCDFFRFLGCAILVDDRLQGCAANVAASQPATSRFQTSHTSPTSSSRFADRSTVATTERVARLCAVCHRRGHMGCGHEYVDQVTDKPSMVAGGLLAGDAGSRAMVA